MVIVSTLCWLNSLTEDQDIRTACYIECPLPHPTFMAHREIWQRLGGYRDIDGPEDYDLVLRAMLLGIRLGKPPGILLDWREHPGRLTHTDKRYRREAFTRCRAWAAIQPQSEVGPGRWTLCLAVWHRPQCSSLARCTDASTAPS